MSGRYASDYSDSWDSAPRRRATTGKKKKKRPNSQKASFRKREQNKASMFLVTFAVLVIVGVIFVSGVGLQKKIDAYNERIAELETEIKRENDRANDLEEYRKYTQTKGFVEEIAQEQLGLVNEGEIIFYLQE